MRTRTTTSKPADPLGYRLQEGGFIVLSAIAVFCMVALITYHSSDPGWSHTTTEAEVHNAAGLLGAWFSDLVFYFFGYIAYLFPLLMGVGGVRLFQHRFEAVQFNRWLWGFRAIGLVITLATGCGLASMYFSIWDRALPAGAGGICGQLMSISFAGSLGELGTTVVLLALFLASVTLTTGLSWFGLMDTLSRRAWELLLETIDRLRERFQQWRARQQHKAKRKLPSMQATAAPRIKAPTKELIKSPAVKQRSTPSLAPPRRTPSRENSNELPSVALLDESDVKTPSGYSTDRLEALSKEVEERLLEFGVRATVVSVYPGPVVTRFELELAAGVKVSKISGLSKDLARALSVTRVRVVEVIPGKSVIGLEIPNEDRELVSLRDILESDQYTESASHLSLALGKDISGTPAVVNLAKMPHLLVAGTTGSGKSVGINVMLLSLLYKATPEDVRLILIDPKMLELSVYDGIPHLLTPVVTDMKEAASALRWCVGEMERRYQLMAALGVRNIVGYNRKIQEAERQQKPLKDPLHQPESGQEPGVLTRLPYIVVIIDEFADMMMVVGKKVEELIARIAQKARAAGIHLILATQRPSVDVITGLIKANIPTRIAFQVSSRIDSRTILDQQGAEQLLGHGDMLYLAPGSGVPVRIHGAFVSDEEVHAVVQALRQLGEPEYVNEIVGGSVSGFSGLGFDEDDGGEQDELYDQAVQIVCESRRASISHLQRRLKIGYNRAARLVEAMEAAGLVSPMQSNGVREVLAGNH